MGQQNELWRKVVAQAWADDSCRKRLLADPATVLKEAGLQLPPGVQIHIDENSNRGHHLHPALPAKPTGEELSEAELTRVAGAGSGAAHCSAATSRSQWIEWN